VGFRNALGTLLWFALAPGGLLGLLPWLLARWARWRFPLETPWRGLGLLLIVSGLAVILDGYVRFVREGKGTPAPYAPTKRLVVTGLFRHVRNPIYVAALAILLGEALFFMQPILLGYAVVAWAALHLWVVRVEEPRLRRDFGSDYEAYCQAVRRWIPRWHAWSGQA